MPIYEYRCKACGHTLEAIQKLADKPLTKCPECSGKLEKLVSRAAFQLKGGGWYSEGYGKSGSSSSSSDASSPEKPSSDSGEKKAAAGGCGSGSCGCH
ncbi:MAG TPA: zinc ribbon domain-containing protein [Candidatus Bathyarchaeia archaeon]|nr:zinc ribbon domain-containing protein [Candidatus Bathyarchaeia archaeon]